MNATHTNMILALSLFAGACATDTDLDSVSHAVTDAPILLAEEGTGQDREVTSTFDPLVVTLTDGDGNPIPNTTITFTAPMTGASATFRFDGQAVTDAAGRAELRPYANTVAGTYTVWAHADGATPMPFVLTNMAGPPAQLVTVLGAVQGRQVGMPFVQPLTVEVRDFWNNPVEGAPVTFVAPATGPTTRMTDNTTETDNEGRAAVFAIAGDTVGSYTVAAKVAGAPAVTFSLSNLASDFRPTQSIDALPHLLSTTLVAQ